MAGRSASVYPALWNEALQSGKTGKGEALRRNLYLSNNAKRFSRVKRFVLIVRRHHSEALPAEPLVSAEALPFEPQEGSASFGEMGAPRPDLERGSASARRIFFRSIPMAQKGKRFPPGRAGDDSKDTGLEKSFTQTEAFRFWREDLLASQPGRRAKRFPRPRWELVIIRKMPTGCHTYSEQSASTRNARCSEVLRRARLTGRAGAIFRLTKRFALSS